METFKANRNGRKKIKIEVHMYQPTRLQLNCKYLSVNMRMRFSWSLYFSSSFLRMLTLWPPPAELATSPPFQSMPIPKTYRKKIIYINLSCKIVKNILLSSYCLLNKKCQNLSFVTYFFSKFLDIDSDSDIRFKHSMMLKIVISDSSVQKNVIV